MIDDFIKRKSTRKIVKKDVVLQVKTHSLLKKRRKTNFDMRHFFCMSQKIYIFLTNINVLLEAMSTHTHTHKRIISLDLDPEA